MKGARLPMRFSPALPRQKIGASSDGSESLHERLTAIVCLAKLLVCSSLSGASPTMSYGNGRCDEFSSSG